MKVLLVGTGYMATEYAKVLIALNISFDVVGRGVINCNKFKELYHTINVYEGGIENFYPITEYTHAIVASNIDSLASHTKRIITFGIKNILLEKPGGTNLEEISSLESFAKNHHSTVLIAYNRRFYASTIKCRESIEMDGGVTSFHFEFTEWSHATDTQNINHSILNNWILANSTHVIDTAFYLCGKPKEMSCYQTGSLNWHPSGSVYSGAGITDTNALFSYIANWEAPGRWNLEIMTKKHRYIFKPMEKLQVMSIGSVAVNYVDDIDYSLDEDFKHGLYLQTKAFTEGDLSNFITLSDQKEMVQNFYKQISNYHN